MAGVNRSRLEWGPKVLNPFGDPHLPDLEHQESRPTEWEGMGDAPLECGLENPEVCEACG